MKNFDSLNESEKQKVYSFFSEWKSHKNWTNNRLKTISSDIVFENLRNDHFLNNKSFKEIIYFIINSKGNIEERLENLINYTKQYKRKGKNIKYSFKFVGSVMIKKIIRRKLLLEGSFDTPDEIDIFFSKHPRYYSDKEKNIHLKRGKDIWLTWDELDIDNKPFNFSINNGKDEIVNALGLGNYYLNDDVVFLVFIKVHTKSVFRPTIADANFDNDLWRPTKISFLNYGLTNPVKSVKLKSGYNIKRPEAVIDSKNITFNNLENSLNKY